MADNSETKVSGPRVWTLDGDESPPIVIEGPSLSFFQQVDVIEHSAFQKLLNHANELVKTTNLYGHRQTQTVLKNFRAFKKENGLE